jgi:predicted nucleotidyltransferase
MTDAEFLREVKRNVQEIDPQAEVWLFGSRARGDARHDSDWDFLVLTDELVNWGFKSRLRDHLYDVGFTSSHVISTVIAEDILPLLPQTEEFIDVIKRLIIKS